MTVTYVVSYATYMTTNDTNQCPNCGHGAHDNKRCSGTADNGTNWCACSWPNPSNYATMNYAAGSNVPGFLPDDGGHVFATFAEAQAWLIDLMLWEADTVDTEDAAEDLTHAAEDVNLWSTEQDVTVAGQAYWIMETDEDLTD